MVALVAAKAVAALHAFHTVHDAEVAFKRKVTAAVRHAWYLAVAAAA